MKTIKLVYLIISVAALVQLSSCGNDDDGAPQKIATVVTDEDITATATSATVSGKVVDNGNATISEAGFVYSSNVDNPTTADNKKTVTSFDTFSGELTGLSSGTSYNVRAYAINAVGTAYGEKRTFQTGNLAPIISGLTINGTIEVGKDVQASFQYSDSESDVLDEAATIYVWYLANDATGVGAVPIPGATSKTYHIEDKQDGKFIAVKVTPRAKTGTLEGAAVTSPYTEVGAETVTFTYAKGTVTYGVITGPSGKKWLDRNLGATRVAQSISDHQAAGDAFQWGRLDDGHQKLNRTGVNAGDISGVTGITSTSTPYETSSGNVPTTDKFIIDGSSNGDWRNPQENVLWQGVNGINNPCPQGWRIPTKTDWDAEELTSGNEAFEKLKMPLTGLRQYNNGVFDFMDYGMYWTSTSINNFPPQMFSNYVYFDATSIGIDMTNRGNGAACRCIKD